METAHRIFHYFVVFQAGLCGTKVGPGIIALENDEGLDVPA